MERDRPQHERSAVCVIAQQYSPATFVALRFYTPKDKPYALAKMLFQFFLTSIRLREPEIT